MKAIRSLSTTIALIVATAMLLVAGPNPAGAVIAGGNGRIAFVSDSDGDNEIYAMRSDGTGVVQLTFNTANDTDPSVSGDGTRIAFISDRDGGPDLYIMPIDGSTATRLTINLGATVESHPSWAPNGSAIAFAGLTGTDSEIYSIKPNGTSLINLTSNATAFDANPAWSPGGIKIAFDSTNRGGDTGTDVYTMNNDGTSVLKLTTTGNSRWW